MKFIKKRIQVICDQLDKFKIVQKQELNQWQVKYGEFLNPAAVESSAEPWINFDSFKEHWYGPDKWCWFRLDLKIPQSFDKRPLWLNIKTQIEEWDDGKNPQFLLFIDGEITQGLDMNHREVLISESARAGKEIRIDVQAYTGTLHSEFKFIGELLDIEPDVAGLFYDLQVPLWAMNRMAEDCTERYDILTVLNDTINLIDLRDVSSPEFLESVRKSRGYVKNHLYEDLAGHNDIIATCIGHTHIDVAWWWTVEQTRTKTARSFATVLKLMEEYPDYRFMSSQPVLYAFVKERYPELYKKIKKRVKEGRWETEGAMWVEADCNLTSGESLIRQFVHGKKFFKDEFGVDNRVLWLPDVFGYSGALPQIIKGCGNDYFMTTKLSWNQFNKIPADTLMWEGIDGTSVFTHFISTLGVGQPTSDFFTTYNGMLHPDAIMGGWERYQNKDINNDILIAFGHGDGGGGPTRAMLETEKRMHSGVKGMPKTRQESVLKYFEELEERVINNKRLPHWVGEFYFEYHRGTYTSMARNKRSNRKSEILLMDLELFSVLAKDKIADFDDKLDEMWKLILLNQFHDILPGTSIKEVYEQTAKEYAYISETGNKLIEECLSVLNNTGDDFVVYNTLGFERDDVVLIEEVVSKKVTGLKGLDGEIYPLQHTEKGAMAYLKNLPSKGSTSFALSESDTKSPFTIDEKGIKTPFYNVIFDEDGFIKSLYDKDCERELLTEKGKGNRLRVYEDKPIYYDNWDIDIYYTEKFWDVKKPVYFEWIEVGSVFATLKIEWKYQRSLIKQKITFYSETKRIDFETWVDWKENQQLLKTQFDLNLHTDEATFDIQFGNVKRKTHTNTSWDKARFESCAHQWVDVAEGDFGVALLNDCKYGHSVNGGKLSLTLIKSGIEPNPVTDQETHFFSYALYPHDGTWQDAQVPRIAAGFNQPALTRKGSVIKSSSLASVNKRAIMLQTVKQSMNKKGVVFRLYEYENSRGTAKLKTELPIKKAWECNMLEEKLTPLDFDQDTISFNYRPFEIKTIYIEI